MLHTKFRQNRPSASLKIFKSFWQTSWSCDQHYVDEFLLTCIYKLTFKIWLKMAQWFLKKVSIKFSYVNDISLLTQLVSDHRLQKFLKNPLSLLFSYRKAYVTKINLAVKSVKVNPGSSLNKL